MQADDAFLSPIVRFFQTIDPVIQAVPEMQ